MWRPRCVYICVHGELLQWIDVDNGLRQGCSMVPMLFNVYACLVQKCKEQIADTVRVYSTSTGKALCDQFLVSMQLSCYCMLSIAEDDFCCYTTVYHVPGFIHVHGGRRALLLLPR